MERASMDYRICLVEPNDMFGDRAPVGLLHSEEEGTWTLMDAEPALAEALNEFVDTFANYGVTLFAVSRIGGSEAGPFDMWLTRPNFIDDLDAIVFPDVVYAVFDHKIGGSMVRLSPVRENRLFNLFR